MLLPFKPQDKILAVGLDAGSIAGLARTWRRVDCFCSKQIIDSAKTAFPELAERINPLLFLNRCRKKYDAVILKSGKVAGSTKIANLLAHNGLLVLVGHRGASEYKPDFEFSRHYAAVPPDNPRIIFPSETRFLRSKGLSFHSPGSRSAWWKLCLVRWLSAVGIKASLAKCGVTIMSHKRSLIEQSEIARWLSIKLAWPISDLVLYVGSDSIRRKITALAVTEKGGEDVVVKIADSAAGAEAIRQESEALHALKSTFLSSQVPELLFEDKWNGYVIQGQSSLSEGSRSQGSCLTNVHFTFLADLSTLDRKFVSFRSTQFFQNLDRKLENIPADSLLPSVTRSWYEILKKDFADRKVLCHRIHGDFAPWNIREQEGRLFVYDWEDSLSEGLALTDALRFVYRQADLVGPWPGSATMLEKLREVGTRCFSEIGCVEREDYEKYLLAWLVKEYADNRSDRVAKMIEHAASEMQL